MEMSYERVLFKEIGRIIKNFRELHRLSQEELAKDICDRSTISYIESGKQKTPNVVVLSKIAKKLGMNFEAILMIAENNIDNLPQKIRRKVIRLISLGKYQEALALADEFIIPTSCKEHYKFYCYIKGSEAFFNQDIALADDYYLKGLNNLKNVDDKTILPLIDIFLLNAYIANCYDNNKFFTIDIKLLYILKNSIDYYIFLETEQMVRIGVYLADYFRVRELYEVSCKLLEEMEKVIREYNLLEIRIDFDIVKILILFQYKQYFLIDEIVNETQRTLKYYQLTELEKLYDSRLKEIKKYMFSDENKNP